MDRLLALVAVAVPLASAACASHPGFEPLDACADCARGGVAGGAIVRSNTIGWAARPGGGWIRVDGHDLAWVDASFRIVHESDAHATGDVSVLAVAPDDTAFTAASTDDDWNTNLQLAAVAPDGSVRWRHDFAAFDDSTLHVVPTADAVFVSGALDLPSTLGDATISGMFLARLEPRTGAVDWIWSLPRQYPGSGGPDIEVVPRADGTLVVAGTVDGRNGAGGVTLDFGGTTSPISIGTAVGFIGVLDAAGHGVWVRALGGPTTTRVYLPGLLADGAIAITGNFAGAPLDLGNGVVLPTTNPYADNFVAVLEPDGTTRWATGLGGYTVNYSSLAILGDAVAVAGTYSDARLGFGDGVVPKHLDAFVASLTDGALDWVTEAHGAGYLTANVVARAGALDAVVRNREFNGPVDRSFDLGRIHVDGDDVLFANLVP